MSSLPSAPPCWRWRWCCPSSPRRRSRTPPAAAVGEGGSRALTRYLDRLASFLIPVGGAGAVLGLIAGGFMFMAGNPGAQRVLGYVARRRRDRARLEGPGRLDARPASPTGVVAGVALALVLAVARSALAWPAAALAQLPDLPDLTPDLPGPGRPGAGRCSSSCSRPSSGSRPASRGGWSTSWSPTRSTPTRRATPSWPGCAATSTPAAGRC